MFRIRKRWELEEGRGGGVSGGGGVEILVDCWWSSRTSCSRRVRSCCMYCDVYVGGKDISGFLDVVHTVCPCSLNAGVEGLVVSSTAGHCEGRLLCWFESSKAPLD